VRDFPAKELARHQLRKQTPDTFLMNLYAAVPDVVVASTASARQDLRKSRISAKEFIKALKRQKLRQFAAAMNGHLSDLWRSWGNTLRGNAHRREAQTFGLRIF
jgi:hypothetical protein